MDVSAFRVKEGRSVRLKKWPTNVDRFYESDEDYAAQLTRQVHQLSELQNLLYAHDRYAMLLIFQAMDAAGKDGAIQHVMSGVNPQGCQVFSFKHPSAEDLDHDFLWRVYVRVPERGRIGIFNRSYYEEVLAVRPFALPGLYQPHVGLVHQGGGLERLARGLEGHAMRREPPQLGIDEWHQFIGGPGIPLVPALEDAGDVVHAGRRAPVILKSRVKEMENCAGMCSARTGPAHGPSLQRRQELARLEPFPRRQLPHWFEAVRGIMSSRFEARSGAPVALLAPDGYLVRPNRMTFPTFMALAVLAAATGCSRGPSAGRAG